MIASAMARRRRRDFGRASGCSSTSLRLDKDCSIPSLSLLPF